MINYWFISDTHFNHEAFLNFKDDEGHKIRPFSSVEEMNETMIENWNKVVKPGDKVYHLGDVIFGNHVEYDKILFRLNGKKRLILGNHDTGKLRFLSKHFQKIDGVRHLNINGFKCVLSHVPLYEECIERWGNKCIHGHIHSNRINELIGIEQPKKSSIFTDECIERHRDKRYINVCVEQTNYTPINLEALR